MKCEKFLRELCDTFGCAAGKGVAKYSAYLARANAQVAAQARASQTHQMVSFWYPFVSAQLFEALSATSELTGIIVPPTIERLWMQNPVQYGRFGAWAFVFGAWCRPGELIQVGRIQGQLNEELQRLCAINGTPPLRVVKVCRGPNGRISIAVAFCAVIRDARAKKQNHDAIKI